MNILHLLHDPLEELSKVLARLGQQWTAVLGLPVALAVVLVYGLPRLARRAGAAQDARLLREAGLLALGWGGVDLALTAGLPLLRLSYAPVRTAFFMLLWGRTGISGAGTALAVASVLAGRDLPPGGRRLIARGLWAMHAAMALVLVYATYVGGARLRPTRARLAFPGHTPGAPPLHLRLAQISDIHMERLSRRDEAMVALLREARPDLILLTGDFINIDYYDVRAYEDLRALLSAVSALNPPLGVYACLGNVDPPKLTGTLLESAGVHLLVDTAVTLPVDGRRVQILGAATSRGHRWEYDLPHFQAAVAAADAQGTPDFRLLLYHTPDFVPQAARAGVDLYLCGHTHGGQIRLPLVGALRTGSRFGKRYVIGLNRLPNGGYIHTNRGLGFEGMSLPRIRTLCPPEVALFDVTIGACSGENDPAT